jgi:hypothetical protein
MLNLSEIKTNIHTRTLYRIILSKLNDMKFFHISSSIRIFCTKFLNIIADKIPQKSLKCLCDTRLEEAPVQQLLSTLEHQLVQSQLEVLGGYDISKIGEAVANI